MPSMTRTQARRRLYEANAKFKRVYVSGIIGMGKSVVSTADMAAMEKIIDKCLKRLG